MLPYWIWVVGNNCLLIKKYETFVGAKIGQFFDILEIDFFTQKIYSFYQSPLGGHAVISDSILIEHENAWYIFSMGWDD